MWFLTSGFLLNCKCDSFGTAHFLLAPHTLSWYCKYDPLGTANLLLPSHTVSWYCRCYPPGTPGPTDVTLLVLPLYCTPSFHTAYRTCRARIIRSVRVDEITTLRPFSTRGNFPRGAIFSFV